MDELSNSGVPIYADRGAHGGFQLVEGYRTRLTGLTPEEAETLFLSGSPGQAAQLGLGTVLAAAQLKVLAALPPELRSRASRVRQRFHLDAPGWFQEPEVAPHLQAIAEAVWSDRRLTLQYQRGSEDGEIVERTLDPLGLVSKAGVWYLVARAASIRTYRVSRIVDLTILPDRFERPADFDLADYWERSVAAYEAGLPSFPAVIRVRGKGLARLPGVLGSLPARLASAAAGEPDADGWLTLNVRLEDFRNAEIVLLQLGGDAEVIEPIELRRHIADVICSMVELYPASASSQ